MSATDIFLKYLPPIFDTFTSNHDRLVTWFLLLRRWQLRKIRKNRHKNVLMQSLWIRTVTVSVIQRREKISVSVCISVSNLSPVYHISLPIRHIQMICRHHHHCLQMMHNFAWPFQAIFLSSTLDLLFFYSEHSNFECIFSCDDLFLNFLRRDTLHSYISAHILQFQFILIRIYFCYSNLCVYIETKTKNVRKLWNKQTNKTETKTKINQPHTYTNTIDVVNTYFVIVINYSHHMPLPEWQIYRKSRR